MSNDDAGEPNPVAQVIVKRTLQVSAATLLALVLLRRWRGREQARRAMPAVTALTVGGLSAYFVATFYPRTRFPGTPAAQTHLLSSNAVALTFDDGPFPETTPLLLDLLTQAGARATFFLVGERAQAHPELVRRIAAEGHTIGVHGSRHRTMALMSAREIAAELTTAREQIEKALGEPLKIRLLRPPYGFRTWTLTRTAQRLRWIVVAWSRDARDYDGTLTSAEIVRRLTRDLKAGDIVLMHERPQVAEARALEVLPKVLAYCRNRGWNCEAIGDS